MPPTQRRILTALSALSLLLCLATAAFFIQNRWNPCVWLIDAPRFRMLSVAGDLTAQWFAPRNAYGYLLSRSDHGYTFSGHDFLLGSGWAVRVAIPGLGAPIGTTAVWELGLHDWFLCLLFAVLPAWCTTAFLRRKRTPPAGLCAKCGYDLRATPARCPECGAIPRPH